MFLELTITSQPRSRHHSFYFRSLGPSLPPFFLSGLRFLSSDELPLSSWLHISYSVFLLELLSARSLLEGTCSILLSFSLSSGSHRGVGLSCLRTLGICRAHLGRILNVPRVGSVGFFGRTRGRTGTDQGNGRWHVT